jgi:hypothetical protein
LVYLVTLGLDLSYRLKYRLANRLANRGNDRARGWCVGRRRAAIGLR